MGPPKVASGVRSTTTAPVSVLPWHNCVSLLVLTIYSDFWLFPNWSDTSYPKNSHLLKSQIMGINLCSVGVQLCSVGDHFVFSWGSVVFSWVSVGYQLGISWVSVGISWSQLGISEGSVGFSHVYQFWIQTGIGRFSTSIPLDQRVQSGYSRAPVCLQSWYSCSLDTGLQTEYFTLIFEERAHSEMPFYQCSIANWHILCVELPR